MQTRRREIITIGNPVMVFGFREDKLHFWHRNDPFGLTWAHREGIYQSIFYMHLTSQLCGTRLGMLFSVWRCWTMV